MTRRTTRFATGAAALLLICLAAPACSRGGGSRPADAAPFVQVDPKSASPTDRAIAKAQTKLRADAHDADAQLALAQAFLQKARETADPTLYTKAGSLLDEVAAKAPDDVRVLVAQGTLALARHRFADGLTLGRRALAAAPGNEAAYGVVVDASNELGRYGEALRATDDMVGARPNLSSLSRVSYARELRGDLDGAIEAMTEAVTAAAGNGGENVAYVQVLLGNLLLTRGDVAEASRAYDQAEQSFPNFPAAQVGRARVLVAEERFGEAADLLAHVVRIQPLAEYAIAEGDALAAAGRRVEARAAYDLVGAIAQLYRANGVNVDLELALFDADHHPGDESVKAARRALKSRPGILGHDVLAWNLFRAHQVGPAWREARAALATGSRDPLLRFHAATIAAANGYRATARRHLRVVLDSNPRFSAAYVHDVQALARHLSLKMPPKAPAP
jgi:tetratricopeptide (TPR) repeat protein